jgi:hypothetical protein
LVSNSGVCPDFALRGWFLDIHLEPGIFLDYFACGRVVDEAFLVHVLVLDSGRIELLNTG